MRHADGAFLFERARGTQLLAFMLERESVAGLDLHRGDAFGQQRVEPGQGVRDQSCASLAARVALTVETYAAAVARDGFVGGAVEALLKLMGAVAGVDQVSVAIDEAGRDPASLAVDDFQRVECRRGGRAWTGVFNESVAAGDEAILDDTQSRRSSGCQGREPGIPPDTVKAHDGNI